MKFTHLVRRIDVHAHAGSMPSVTFEDGIEPLERMEHEADTDKVIVSSARAVFYDMVVGNEETFAITRGSPMLYMYIYVDPLRPDESLAELERYAHAPHVAGIKTRPEYHVVPGDSEEYLRLFNAAAKLELPALVHTFSLRDVVECRHAAEKTGIKMILAHMGGPEWKPSVDALKGSRHLWLDASCSANDYDKVGYALDVLGASSLVYGSDATLLSPWWTISMFESAGLTDAEKHAIYRENALGIFGRRLG
jgi:hypothetical protein